MEHLHPGQREAERGERGHDQVGGAARVGAVGGDAPVRQVDEQAHVRPLAADAHVRQVTGQVGARLVAVELAVEDVREPGLVGPRLVWFERSARVRARHAPPFHDVDDAPSGGGDAPPLQRGLDLPGAVTLMAVAPDRVHVAGDRVHPPGFGMFDHPVVGGAGNAQYPALRRYRITGGVGPYHCYLRANTGAACSETSTSISNCLLRLRSSTGSFRSGVRLSVARVEPLSRMPRTQRCGVECEMSYSSLISRAGLPFSQSRTICRLNDSS